MGAWGMGTHEGRRIRGYDQVGRQPGGGGSRLRKQNIASDRRGPEAGDGFFHAVSLSGGKDSTCLLLLMIERGLPIDAVIWADTGMEFPEMYAHIAKVGEYLYQERGLHITVLRHPRGFEYFMLEVPQQKKAAIERRITMGQPLYGYGWPGVKVRWCTGQLKTHLIKMKQMRGSDEQYSPSLSLAFSFVYEICFLRSFCLGF